MMDTESRELSASSRKLFDLLRAKQATTKEAARIATEFDAAFGPQANDELQRYLDIGWNTADVYRLVANGSNIRNGHPSRPRIAEGKLIDLGMHPHIARHTVITNSVYVERDPDDLQRGIDNFLTLGFTKPQVENLAIDRPIVLYIEPERINAWLEKRVSDATPEMREFARVVSPGGKTNGSRTVRKRRTQAEAAKPVMHEQPDPAPALVADPTPFPFSPTFPQPPEPEPEPLFEDLPFSPENVERILRKAFDHVPTERETEHLDAAYYGTFPKALKSNGTRTPSERKTEKASATWKALHGRNRKMFSENARNIFDLNYFFEAMLGRDALFLLHRILKDPNHLAVLAMPWNSVGIRMYLLRSLLRVDVLAHPELLLWPFERIGVKTLRYRVDFLATKYVHASQRPFIDLLFAPSGDDDRTFRREVAKATRTDSR